MSRSMKPPTKTKRLAEIVRVLTRYSLADWLKGISQQSIRDLLATSEEQALARQVTANAVGDGRGFDSDENALLVLWEGVQEAFPMTGKLRLARQLADLISRRIHA